MSDNDYPASALKRREEGTAGFPLLIGPKGRVARCTITEPSGSTDLDAATCSMIVAHSKFRPATDESGQPSYNTSHGICPVVPDRSGARGPHHLPRQLN
ncbi:energy transducer TonB [Sphingobium sp.]|uniref:energy transducer TonB n=1 Tax=Sphingobium sp. TaxID=1912891 RepID=UPI003FA7B7A9